MPSSRPGTAWQCLLGPGPSRPLAPSLLRSYYVGMATALSLSHLGSLMRGVRSVDEVGAEERAAALAKRSIKKSSKLWALDLAIRCMDLTTLEGNDTPGKVAALCAKGIRPKPGDATIPVSLVMMEAMRDVVRETGRPVGIKPAGGIRTSKQAIAYLVVLYETLGADWMTPERFRLGASTLLNDVLMQIEKERTGVYQSGDYFTID